jgi:DNA-binding IclR family transcriptional regulator
MSQNPADSVVKKVALLKELTDNADSKITDIVKEVGISKSTAYSILRVFKSIRYD